MTIAPVPTKQTFSSSISTMLNDLTGTVSYLNTYELPSLNIVTRVRLSSSRVLFSNLKEMLCRFQNTAQSPLPPRYPVVLNVIRSTTRIESRHSHPRGGCWSKAPRWIASIANGGTNLIFSTYRSCIDVEERRPSRHVENTIPMRSTWQGARVLFLSRRKHNAYTFDHTIFDVARRMAVENTTQCVRHGRGRWL